MAAWLLPYFESRPSPSCIFRTKIADLYRADATTSQIFDNGAAIVELDGFDAADWSQTPSMVVWPRFVAEQPVTGANLEDSSIMVSVRWYCDNLEVLGRFEPGIGALVTHLKKVVTTEDTQHLYHERVPGDQTTRVQLARRISVGDVTYTPTAGPNGRAMWLHLPLTIHALINADTRQIFNLEPN